MKVCGLVEGLQEVLCSATLRFRSMVLIYELRFYLIITLFQALKSYTGLNLTIPQPLANLTPWIGVPLPGDITQGLRLGCPINQTSQHHPTRDKLKSIAHSHYQIAGVAINPILTTQH